MCAPVGVLRITFGAALTSAELPRLRPHRFHTSFARNFPGYPQHAVDNFSTGVRSGRRALAQRAQQKTRGIECFGKIAFDGPRLAFDLRSDQFRAERRPHQSA